MTKVDVYSGFLGAGKTTLIKKLLKEAYAGEQVVLIENEFGEIGIDGGFMQEAGIQVREMNSGCICCSLTGDFRLALREVIDRYHPDRILIEPSGVGKLSDIVTAVEQVGDDIQINALGTVVDAGKAKMYMRNFGEFFNNQVESAGCIVLSRSQNVKSEKLAECVKLLREKNPGAVIITTPWDELSGEQILSALERRDTLSAALESIEREHEEDEECDDPECECHHHHHDHDHEHEEHEHHHEHEEHDHDDHDHDEHDHDHEHEEHDHEH
ncbi:MAG: GTP-binding protein, partial [Oscillospiraceae bacterium]|nr:GTP-binding protein [Oscillospiraceae bacterium]